MKPAFRGLRCEVNKSRGPLQKQSFSALADLRINREARVGWLRDVFMGTGRPLHAMT
jgi:hypothetical protein